ncbi:MAG TPA: hypothetical protein VE549_01430 [Myxococcaceae bacterium]|nr:hypothetical protein [Myxococcaceae bacterium]
MAISRVHHTTRSGPKRWAAGIAASLGLLLSPHAFALQPIALSQDEFKMFRHWQRALRDPLVQRIKPEGRTAAIARDAGYRLRDLQAAIAKGERAGDLTTACRSNIEEALRADARMGRTSQVSVDLDEPHAIAYVEWANQQPAQLEEEASWIAAVTVRACPVLSSILVWARDEARPGARRFEALISTSAAMKIDPSRAREFADTRYIRLFERVKNGRD